MNPASRLARDFLKGANRDAVNALLCTCAHDLRKLLYELQLFCAQMGIGVSDLFAMLRLQNAAVAHLFKMPFLKPGDYSELQSTRVA